MIALRSCCERIRHVCIRNGYVFERDYLEELDDYCCLMERLIRDLEIVRWGPQQVSLNSRDLSLLRSVVAPAVRFVRPLLRRRGFSADGIRIEGLSDLPSLFVDPDLMTQVFFNLFDNAIKYADGEPGSFQIQVSSHSRGDFFEISVSDDGIGIELERIEGLFGPAVQSPNAALSTGFKTGLYVAREIVRRHGGDLVLASHRKPTIFVISLPRSLATVPPEASRES